MFPNPRVQGLNPRCDKYEFSITNDPVIIIHLCTIVLGFILLALNLYCSLSVAYVTFNTNLSIINRKPMHKNNYFSDVSGYILYWLLLVIIVTENSFDINFANFVYLYSNSSVKLKFSIQPFCRPISLFICFGTFFYISLIAVTHATYVICLILTYVLCFKITRIVPIWVPFLLILLANDIELNPGDKYHEKFFNFMNWNINSLGKNNFERVKLIEAHNSLFNYDLISLCETSLNSEIEIPDPLLNEYSFLPANHPDNVSHGGVGLFYKNSLPLKPRPDLAFDESIVVELKFGRKKIFFTVLYRSPSIHYSNPEFQNFIDDFENLYTNIKLKIHLLPFSLAILMVIRNFGGLMAIPLLKKKN